MHICRTTGRIPIAASHFRSWSTLASELSTTLDVLAAQAVFSDLYLGAWRGHWIGDELGSQLGAAVPSRRPPAREPIAELTDREGRDDADTLISYQLACLTLDQVRARGVRWIVVLAPEERDGWGRDNVLLIDFLAQGCADAGCQLVLVFAGEAATTQRWDLRWLDRGAAAPREVQPRATSALGAVPGIIPLAFVEGRPAPSDALVLPDGRLVMSPLARRAPDQRARDLLEAFLAGDVSPRDRWLAACCFADGVQDDREAQVMLEAAGEHSAAGGDEVAWKLVDQLTRKTTSARLRGRAEVVRQTSLIRLRRWDDLLTAPPPDDEPDIVVRTTLMYGRAWALIQAHRPAEAERYVQALQDLAAPRIESRLYLYAQHLRALHALHRGELQTAIELEALVERRLADARPIDWPASYGNLINLARLYEHGHDLGPCEQYYRRAFGITEGVRSESDLVYTCLSLARVEERNGRPAEALRCWLRSAMHWLSIEVPEALAPRVVEAITLGPREQHVDEISRRLREHLGAAWARADHAPLPVEPEPDPSAISAFCRIDAHEPPRLRHALGSDGWSVFVGEPMRVRYLGAEYLRLARYLWRLLRVLSSAADLPEGCSIVTDSQLGLDLPQTLDATIDSAIRHGVRTLVFAGARLAFDEAELARRERALRVVVAPCVATATRKGEALTLTFKRYLEPLTLTPHQTQILRSVTPETTVGMLVGDAGVRNALRELERGRVLRLASDAVAANPAVGLTCSLATLVPHSEYFAGLPPSPARDEELRMSRFAYVRLEREVMLGSPRAYAHLVLHGEDALRVYHALSRGATPAQLAERFAGLIPEHQLDRFLRFLLATSMVTKVVPEARTLSDEDVDETLRQWQFHDLLLHAESRMGRNREPVGGTFRFLRMIQAPPAIKEPSWGGAILELAPPSAADGFHERTLAGVLDERRTLRTQGLAPITLPQLSDFLYRSARVISNQASPWPREYPTGGAYTRRPYPNGGSRYELELYITANRCLGLPRGVYYYDALHHRLAVVCGEAPEMERLLDEAKRASGAPDTQVLITIASRFQRTAWKYQGLAMALQLKNVGVLVAHMYMVATAMDLAPCALGTGNSDRFARLVQTEYLVESSLGELILGTRAADDPLAHPG